MDLLNIPDWLTADFLKSCLINNEEIDQDISIISHTVEQAVPAGNNYGSLMFRVKIQYKYPNGEDNEHSISIIIKSPLTVGHMEEFTSFMDDIYNKEPKYYNEFIKETYKLCKHNIVPKHYPSPNPLCVVLEDLSTSGYVMVDRHKLLDFEHCQLYVKASAKLHALSVAVNKMNPELIQSLVKENPKFEEKKLQVMKGMFLGGFRCMAAYLEDKKDYKEYLDFFKEASEDETLWNIYQEMQNLQNPLKALTQVDPWCTNMMFKYNSSGKVVGIKLLDFQNLMFTTPVSEFVSFIWASANLDVFSSKLNDLYHLYCDFLNENLAELGCLERLSFEEFKAEVTLLSPLILLITSVLRPIAIADGIVDLNDVMSDKILKMPVKESSIYTIYQGTTFNKNYPKVLQHLDKEGVLQHLKEKIKESKLAK